MDTLAVRLTIPPVGLVGDFHSQVRAPCRAHIRHDTPALGLPLLRSEDTFTKLLVFCLYLLVLLALIHLNEKLRFNFSFISLAFSYLGFNSLIFLVNKKLVTSFVSIVLEVTSFFNFLISHFAQFKAFLDQD
jgi:hypothetical protein